MTSCLSRDTVEHYHLSGSFSATGGDGKHVSSSVPNDRLEGSPGVLIDYETALAAFLKTIILLIVSRGDLGEKSVTISSNSLF